MGAVWCMTANDGGKTKARLLNYRAITACFESLPGRIIPVDLAPVTITTPMATASGDLIDAPCDLPASIPELFNVRNANHTDLGPICNFTEADWCALEVRGRNFGVEPTVTLGQPSEHLDAGDPMKSPPTVMVTNTTVVNYNNTEDHHYDSVREPIGID